MCKQARKRSGSKNANLGNQKSEDIKEKHPETGRKSGKARKTKLETLARSPSAEKKQRNWRKTIGLQLLLESSQVSGRQDKHGFKKLKLLSTWEGTQFSEKLWPKNQEGTKFSADDHGGNAARSFFELRLKNVSGRYLLRWYAGVFAEGFA